MWTPGTQAEWHAWWGSGDWQRLDPAIRQLVRCMVPRTATLDSDAIEDIAAAVVVKCWRMAYVPDEPRLFVVTCTRNQTLDWLKAWYVRRRATAAEAEVYMAQAEDPHEGGLGPMIRAAEDIRRVGALREAIRQLPKDLQRPFVLHEFHQRTIGDLAEQFGVKEGAMKMRVCRARARVRRALKGVTVVPRRSGRPRHHKCTCGSDVCPEIVARAEAQRATA